MATYRFYPINAGGRIRGPAVVHDLPDDAAALIHAKHLKADCDIEIWQGTRLVETFKPGQDEPVPPSPAAPASTSRS